MQDEELNNEGYEIPTENIGEDVKLVQRSTVAEVITAASNVDPSRFWIVFMIALILALTSAVVFGGGYLVDQGKKKDHEITELRKELKACPEATLENFKKQQQAIDELKSGLLENRGRIQEIKKEKIEEVNNLKHIEKKLDNEINN